MYGRSALSWPSRLVTAGAAILVGLATTVAVAPAAHAAVTCSGTGYSWVGLGDGTSWTNAANWDPNGVPAVNDSADISLIAGGSANVTSDSVTVCDLTLGGAVMLNTGVGGMTVNNMLDWHAAGETSVISGSLTLAALGSATLTSSTVALTPGALVFASSDGTTPATLTFAGAAGLDAGTSLSLTNNLSNMNVTGSLKLTAGSQIQSTVATSDDTNAQMVVTGTVSLDGSASTSQVDINVGTTGIVDLAGNTWTDTGLSWSRWLAGALVKSTGAPGTLLVTGGAGFLVDGTSTSVATAVTVDSGVTLAVDGGSLLTDGMYFNTALNGVVGSPGTLTGAGTLDIRAAKLGGFMTLDTGFNTVATTTGTRLLDAFGSTPMQALWENKGTMTIKAGVFGAATSPSVLVNDNRFNVCAGVTLSGVSRAADATAMLHNVASGTISVLAASNPACTGASGTTVVNDGFSIYNDGVLNVASGMTLSLLGLNPYTFANNSQIAGGGRVETGDNTVALTVDHAVSIVNGSTLSLKHGAKLIAGIPVGSAILSAGTSTGTFEWADGTVTGPLTTSGTLTVNVVGGAGTTRTLSSGSTWTLLSPTNITAAEVMLASDAVVNVNATLRLSGQSAGFGHVTSPTAGHAITINSSGALVSSSGTRAVFDFPLVNKGGIHLGAKSTLDAGYGISQTGSAANTHIDAGETFNVEKTGVGSAMGTFYMSAGKFFGGGSLRANLSQSGGVVEAGMSHAKVGTLYITGSYAQAASGLLGLTLKSTSSHSMLKVYGAVSVKGKVEFDVSGYRPKVGTKVSNLVIGKSVGGRFVKVINAGAASHTAWKPVMAKTTIAAALYKV